MEQDALTGYLDAAVEAARRGAAVLEEWRSRFSVREKGRSDLVTEADVGSQRAIRTYLQERFPDHAFLGEEEGAGHGTRPGRDAPPTWIVDPLDGTTNYVHDCPMYCVSVGLQVAGEMVVGVVLDPSRPELFKAAKGRGAWLNDRRLQVSRISKLQDAMLATGFPPDMRGQDKLNDWWHRLSLQTQSLRRTGSTALNMAYIAAGRFDGYWAFDNHVWDVAGAMVLVSEAGGRLTNIDGSVYDPYTPDALVTNALLHPTLLDVFHAKARA